MPKGTKRGSKKYSKKDSKKTVTVYKTRTTKPGRTGGKSYSYYAYNPATALRAWNPFPNEYFCKLRYCETFTKTVGTGGVFGTIQKMNLNSLYDPNNTGGGHQPYGYDQISALYRRYLVRRADIMIEFVNPNADGMVAGVMLQSSGGVGTLAGQSVDTIKEQPTSWTKPVQNTGSQRAVFKSRVFMSRLEGLNRIQWSAQQDDYGALVSANPTLMPSIQFASASDAGSSVDYMFVRVLITFHCQFYDRILQAYS